MKKEMKYLEDRIAELTGTNATLSDTVRAMRKKKGDVRCDADNDRGANGGDEDGDIDDLGLRQGSSRHATTRASQVCHVSGH